MLTAIVVILNVIHVLTCVLMTVVILMQASKEGGGFGVAFGGGATETVFGSRAGNVLTRATVILASIFLVTSLFLAKLEPKRAHRLAVATPAATAPAQTGSSGEAPAPPSGDAPAAETPADQAPAGEAPAPEAPAAATPAPTAPETP